ncbi:serine hydrolase domain-containing protein [Myxococcus xanthus]|nr:serine hydrolase domain-containing protein [Myxococcus xanthus]
MRRIPTPRPVRMTLTGLSAVVLLTGADTRKPTTQWMARPAEAARITRVEQGFPSIPIPGEKPRHLPLQEWMALYEIPGLSIAVFDRGSLAWAKGYGVKEAGGTAPITVDTLFQAASISKPVAALAAMHHAEKRKWSLDEDINARLTSWKLPDNAFTREQKVTLRRLLSHSAGTTVHGFPGYAAQAPVPTLQQLLDGEQPANSAPVRVDTVPGTLTRYSGGGTSIVQQMLTDQLQKPFAQIMKEAVLAPLGLKHSTYEQPLPKALEPLAAVGARSGGKNLEGRWHTYPEQAAAGLWTTPSDLARIAMEVSKAAQGKSQRVVSQAMAKQMLTRQSQAFGIGFHLPPGQAWFGHGGSNAGYRSLLVAFAETGSGVAIMSNSDDGGLLFDRIVASVATEYGWKGITHNLENAFITTDLLVRTKGVDTAVSWFTAHKRSAPAEEKVTSDILNVIGYARLNKGQVADAVKLFEANASLFPEDANTHDSLGEGYAAAGRKDEAISRYKKSLELNPKNDNAVKKLRELGAATATAK